MTRPRCAFALGAALLALGPGALAAQRPVQQGAQQGAVQGRAMGKMAGRVVDGDHRPIDRAEVFLRKGDDELGTRTDSAGHFSFGAVPAGEYHLAVRRLGFQPRELLLQALVGGAAEPEVALEPMPVGFEEIHVVAKVNESYGKLAEFYERRARKNRQGHFFEQAEFSRFDYWMLSDYLRGLPGVTVTTSPRIGNTVRFRGCQPMIWLDGQRADHAEVDELVSAKDVAAMEVYVSPAGSPGQYRDLAKPCGSILIWKKS